jgi:ABC-2 type transport system permease protein
MSNLMDMIWIESRKALRSKMPLMTALGGLLMTLGIAFLIFISKNPGVARQLGLISAKADLIASTATNWPTYLGLLAQLIAAGGFFLCLLIISWVFGREFADGTVKDMLAVPVPRLSILLAKFIVFAVWSGLLALAIFLLGLVMGAMIQLPQGTSRVLLQGIALVTITAWLTIAVVLPFALLASAGRGYLLPIGGAILTLIMANLVIVTGWGEYFPWSVPGLYATMGGKENALPPISYWIVILTGIAGMFGTYLWWMHADQSR